MSSTTKTELSRLRLFFYLEVYDESSEKTLCIAGSMLLPIKVGEPAMIREHDGGYRRTTTVLKMDKLSDSEIKFETQNTHYVLHLTKAKVVAV